MIVISFLHISFILFGRGSAMLWPEADGGWFHCYLFVCMSVDGTIIANGFTMCVVAAHTKFTYFTFDIFM
jgi:hypothetical protein